jgi:tRNA nucleotidyltransferase/poly(A) polymerase
MPDYIYLLENRLSPDQQHALRQMREVAREAGQILFLTGAAVRDLTGGFAVRELEVAIQGNALKLKKQVQKHGGTIWGEDENSRTLYLGFPGTVRLDFVSTVRIEYPKPGKPVYHPGSIHEFLRCRDFTASSMALSLNEGSYGLLMDPLNGVADIETRTLRLATPYRFYEEPSLLIRAIRFKTRLGWEFDEKTASRYANAIEEDVISHLSTAARGYELEQIVHEEEGLRALRALDQEGWMKVLFPGWTPSKADENKLNALHELAVRFEVLGVRADLSAAQAELLTIKLGSREVASIKRLFPRHGFAEEWSHLDHIASAFQKILLAKDKQTPSEMYKLFMSHDPEAILWLGFTSRESAVKNRYEKFLTDWPAVRQQIPYAQLTEMRITPELPIYKEVIEKLFLAMIDGKLTTPEEFKAFLEPYSPPAPPPPVSYKRGRVKRAAGRVKEIEVDDEDDDIVADDDEELEELDGGDLELPEITLDEDDDEEEPGADDDDDLEDGPPKGKAGKSAKPGKAEKPKPEKAEKKPAKAEKAAAAPPAKPAKVEPKKPEPKPAPAPAKKAAAPAPAKKAAKPAAAKKPAKPAPKPKAKPTAPKSKPKPAAKKPAKGKKK